MTLLDDLRLLKNIVFILLTELKNLQQVNYDCEPMLAGPAPVGLRMKVFCAEWYIAVSAKGSLGGLHDHVDSLSRAATI